MPLVSIITPAYNAADYLAATIHSAQQQTINDFELLVVDDGSTDDTAWITEQFAARDQRVKLIRQSNAGSAAARNAALRAARGDFFALLDSDDVWMPDFLEAQLAILTQRPHVDIVSANAINLGGRLHGQPLKPVSHRVTSISLLGLIEVEDSVCIMSVFRRRVVERTGGFKPSVPDNEDYDFWLRAANAGCSIVFNSQPFGCYRRRLESKSANEGRMITGIIRVLSDLRHQCADRPAELAAIDRQVARLERRQLFRECKAALLRREFAQAGSLLARLDGDDVGYREWAIVRIGKAFPQVLLWAYRAKSGWRSAALRLSGIHSFVLCM